MKWFSKNLIFLREKLGKGQADAARELGYTSRSRLANYEGGHSKPAVEDLLKLGTYFKVSIDDLLNSDLSQPQNNNEVSEPPGVFVSHGSNDEAYVRLLIESLETRIRSLEGLIATLSTSNEDLKTNNEKLLSMLKANYTALKAAPVVKVTEKKEKK